MPQELKLCSSTNLPINKWALHYPGAKGGLELGGGVEGGGGVEAEDLERRRARIQYLPRLSLEAPTERRDARTAEGRAAPRRRRRWQCPRAAERGRVAARGERRCDGGHHCIAVASDRLPQFRRSRGSRLCVPAWWWSSTVAAGAYRVAPPASAWCVWCKCNVRVTTFYYRLAFKKYTTA